MNREERVPLGSREFWNYFHSYDWHHELRRLEIPSLIYAGTLDKQRLSPNEQLVVRALGVDVIAFDGLGHFDSGLNDPDSPATTAVSEWLHQHGWH